MRLPKKAVTRLKSHMPGAFSLSGFWCVVGKLARRGGRKLIILAIHIKDEHKAKAAAMADRFLSGGKNAEADPIFGHEI